MSRATPSDWFMRALGCVLIALLAEAVVLLGVAIFAIARMPHP